jgi:hypothetical protein
MKTDGYGRRVLLGYGRSPFESAGHSKNGSQTELVAALIDAIGACYPRDFQVLDEKATKNPSLAADKLFYESFHFDGHTAVNQKFS